MRRRASMREGPLAELFRAAERGQRQLTWRPESSPGEDPSTEEAVPSASLETERDAPEALLRRAPRGMSPPARIAPSALVIALVGIVAVTALVMSAWQLAHSGGAQPASLAMPAAGVPAGVPATTPAVVESKQAPETTLSQTEQSTARSAKLVLAAAYGDCWLEVHAGSATGRLLFAGTLEQGRSLRFVKRRLWLAFGAGGNLEVTLNGQRVESFPTGTATVIVTAKGVSAPGSV